MADDSAVLPTGFRATVAELQALPRVARRLIAVNALNAAGSGLVLPLLVVYLHEVRHFGYDTATGAVAATSIGAMLGAPLAGWASDQLGRTLAAFVSLVLAGVGSLGYVVAVHPAIALTSGLVQGVGIGGTIAWNALIADAVPQDKWPVVFGFDFAAVNALMGLGGLLGGLAVTSANSIGLFQTLYVVDAVTFVVTGAVVVLTVRGMSARSAEVPSVLDDTKNSPDDPAPRGSYRQVLRDRRMLGLLTMVLVLYTVGYSQLTAGMPALILDRTGLGAGSLGILFAVDTAVVVLAQILLGDRIRALGTRRLAVTALPLCWAAFWACLLTATATAVPHRVAALLFSAFGMAVFALGELLLASVGPTLVNMWSGDHDRGRYNAAYGFAGSLGFTVGPLLAGSLVGHGHAVAMAVGGLVGCLVMAASAPSLLGRSALEPDGQAVSVADAART